MFRTKSVAWCWLILMAAGGAVYADEGPEPPQRASDKADADRGGHHPPRCVDCPIITIEQGEQSGFAADTPGFLGMTGVIKDPHSWAEFWHRHSRDDTEPPRVDFRHWRVLVAVQGMQTSGCGPEITIAHVHRCPTHSIVRVIDDERPGTCDVVTNPFHIAKVPLECLGRFTSIGFKSYAPGAVPGAMAGQVVGVNDAGETIPLAEATVRLARPGDDAMVAEVRTNRDGYYQFHDLAPGPYAAGAFAMGYEPVVGVVVQIQAGQTLEQDFVLHPGSPQGGVIMGEVRGGLSWDDAEPLRRAHVVLFRAGGPDAPPIPIRETETDCDGLYRFFEVPPGEYEMVAAKLGFIPERLNVVLPPDVELVEQHFLLQPE